MKKVLFLVTIILVASIGFSYASEIKLTAPYLPCGTSGVGCTSIGRFTDGKILIDNHNSYQVYDVETYTFSKLDLGTESICQIEKDWYVTSTQFDMELFKYTIYPDMKEFISTNSKPLFLDKSGTNIQFSKDSKTITKFDHTGKTIWTKETGLEPKSSSELFKINDDFFVVSTTGETEIFDVENGELKHHLDFGVSKWAENISSEKLAILSGRIYSLPDFKLITEIVDAELFELDDDGFSAVFKNDNSIELIYFDSSGKDIETLSYEIKLEERKHPLQRIGEHLLVLHEKNQSFDVINIRTGEIEKLFPYQKLDENQFRGFKIKDCFMLYHGRVMNIYNPVTTELKEIEVPTRMRMIDDDHYWYYGSDNITIKSLDTDFERTIPIVPGGYDYYEEGYGILFEIDGENILEFTVPKDSKYCPIIHSEKVRTKIPRPIDGRLISYENGYGLFRIMHGEYYDYSYYLYEFKDRKWNLLKSWEHVDGYYFEINREKQLLSIRFDMDLQILDLSSLEIINELKMAFYSSERAVFMIDDLLYTNVRVFDYSEESLYSGKKLEYLGRDDNNLYFKDGHYFITIEDGRSAKWIKFEDDEPEAPFGNNVYAPPFLYDMNVNRIQWLPYGTSYNAPSSNKICSFVDDDSVCLMSKKEYSGSATPITKYKPCQTFSLKKLESENPDEATFEVKATRDDGLSEKFSGEFYLISWDTDNTKPIFAPLGESIEITSLKPGLSKKITFTLPESSENVVLVTKSNGLLDVENSELSDIDDLFRTKYDGIITSFEERKAVSLTIWEGVKK